MWKSAVYDIYFRTATKTGRMNCSQKWVQCREKRLGTCVWKLRGRRGVERGRGETVDVMSCLRREFGCNLCWSYFIIVNLRAGVDVLLGGGDHPEGSWSPAHCALWAAGPVFVGAILAQPFSLPPCLLFPCFSRLLNVHHSRWVHECKKHVLYTLTCITSCHEYALRDCFYVERMGCSCSHSNWVTQLDCCFMFTFCMLAVCFNVLTAVGFGSGGPQC